MKLAARRAARGEPGTIPFRLGVHMVAARYGQAPASVRAWPADDYLDAVRFLSATGGVGDMRPPRYE